MKLSAVHWLHGFYEARCHKEIFVIDFDEWLAQLPLLQKHAWKHGEGLINSSQLWLLGRHTYIWTGRVPVLSGSGWPEHEVVTCVYAAMIWVVEGQHTDFESSQRSRGCCLETSVLQKYFIPPLNVIWKRSLNHRRMLQPSSMLRWFIWCPPKISQRGNCRHTSEWKPVCCHLDWSKWSIIPQIGKHASSSHRHSGKNI